MCYNGISLNGTRCRMADVVMNCVETMRSFPAFEKAIDDQICLFLIFNLVLPFLFRRILWVRIAEAAKKEVESNGHQGYPREAWRVHRICARKYFLGSSQARNSIFRFPFVKELLNKVPIYMKLCMKCWTRFLLWALNLVERKRCRINIITWSCVYLFSKGSWKHATKCLARDVTGQSMHIQVERRASTVSSRKQGQLLGMLISLVHFIWARLWHLKESEACNIHKLMLHHFYFQNVSFFF